MNNIKIKKDTKNIDKVHTYFKMWDLIKLKH